MDATTTTLSLLPRSVASLLETPSNCVCVQNLPHDATERGVLRFFSEEIGDCVDAIVPVDERSGNTKASRRGSSRARGKLPKPADANTREEAAFESWTRWNSVRTDDLLAVRIQRRRSRTLEGKIRLRC